MKQPVSDMKIHIVLTGRGQTRGGQLPAQLELPENSSVSEALTVLRASLPEGESLPESCLLTVAGTHLGTLGQHQDQQLVDGQELLLIAPMAGG